MRWGRLVRHCMTSENKKISEIRELNSVFQSQSQLRQTTVRRALINATWVLPRSSASPEEDEIQAKASTKVAAVEDSETRRRKFVLAVRLMKL